MSKKDFKRSLEWQLDRAMEETAKQERRGRRKRKPKRTGIAKEERTVVRISGPRGG